MEKQEDTRELVDFVKLVGGELTKIDKMSSSNEKIAPACKLDINKIMPKHVESNIHNPNVPTIPVQISSPQQTINGSSVLEELIKMNQKFDLLLGVFLKKKKRRKSKPKILLNEISDGQPNSNP
jgi:hypothetical protein